MHYSVQPRRWIFAKGYEFLLFAKNMGGNVGKNISKNLSGKYNQKLLDHAKHQTHLKLLQISNPKNSTNNWWFGNKIDSKIMGVSKKIHNKIIQRQLQMNMIKKYLKKDTYLQKKDRKLLIIWY